jgi:hypothetical protein
VTRGPFLTMPLGKEDVSAEKVSKRSWNDRLWCFLLTAEIFYAPGLHPL